MHIWQLYLLVLALVLAIGSLLVALKLMQIVRVMQYKLSLIELLLKLGADR